MIRNFLHKGLKLFYTKGDGSKLPAEQRQTILEIFDILDSITNEKDILFIGKGIHPLKGNKKGKFALTVSANYRITFSFLPPDIIDVDYEDYH